MLTLSTGRDMPLLLCVMLSMYRYACLARDTIKRTHPLSGLELIPSIVVFMQNSKKSSNHIKQKKSHDSSKEK